MTFFTRSGASSNNLLQSGSGRVVLVRSGNGDQLNAAGSTGYDIIFGGSGAESVSLGSGTGIFLAGSGIALFDFVSGTAGSVSISGFDPGKDKLALFGYDGSEAAKALHTTSVTGGNTMLSLTDGTHITLLDVTTVTPNFIVLAARTGKPEVSNPGSVPYCRWSPGTPAPGAPHRRGSGQSAVRSGC